MKKVAILLTFVILIGVGIYALTQNQGETQDNSKPKIAATIFPIYDIARNIAGDEVEVKLILPPGASPHTYDASPEDLKKVSGSDAVFMIGHGLDDWSSELAQSAGVENNIVVDKNIELQGFPEMDHGHEDGEEHHLGEEEHEDEHGHTHEGTDPHYWLSATNGIAIAAQIRDELKMMYPESAEVFDANYQTFDIQITALQSELKEIFADKEGTEFATFHNAWNYYAGDFGLEVVTTFEEFPGESPSPEYLREFTEKVEEYNLSVVYNEPQLSTKALEPIAQDHGVQILTIDPIGGTEELATYLDLLRYNGLQISKSL